MLIAPSQSDRGLIKDLRRLKHLAVVDVELDERRDCRPADAADRERERKAWKRELVNLLKDSPSTERKFLKWTVTKSHLRTVFGWAYEVVESEELEVLPETSL